MTKENFLILIRYIMDRVYFNVQNNPSHVSKDQRFLKDRTQALYKDLKEKQDAFKTFVDILKFITELHVLKHNLMEDCEPDDRINHIINLRDYITFALTLGFGSKFYEVGDRVCIYDYIGESFRFGTVSDQSDKWKIQVRYKMEDNLPALKDFHYWEVFKLDEDQQEVPK